MLCYASAFPLVVKVDRRTSKPGPLWTEANRFERQIPQNHNRLAPLCCTTGLDYSPPLTYIFAELSSKTLWLATTTRLSQISCSHRCLAVVRGINLQSLIIAWGSCAGHTVATPVSMYSLWMLCVVVEKSYHTMMNTTEQWVGLSCTQSLYV